MEAEYRKVQVSEWLGQDDSSDEAPVTRPNQHTSKIAKLTKAQLLKQKIARIRAEKTQPETKAKKSSTKRAAPVARFEEEELDVDKLMMTKKKDTLLHDSDAEEDEESRASDRSEGDDGDESAEVPVSKKKGSPNLDQSRFEKLSFDGGKNGRLLFELQKSFGGDSRFKLEEEFADDVDVTRLSEKVKLSIASSGIDQLATNEDEFERLKETEKGLDILQGLLPSANLFIKKKTITEFKPVARFDPTSTYSTQLKAKPQEFFKGGSGSNMVGKKAQPLGKDVQKLQKKQVQMSKGVDKLATKLAKANDLLRQSAMAYKTASTAEDKDLPNPFNQGRVIQTRDPSIPIIKEIDKQKWKEMNKSKEELKTFKLFG